MEYFVVYAADNPSMIVLRDPLANGEIKETMETFGLGVGNRDMLRGGECQCHPSFDRSVIKAISSSPARGHGTLPFLHLEAAYEVQRPDHRNVSVKSYLCRTVDVLPACSSCANGQKGRVWCCGSTEFGLLFPPITR